MISCSIGLKTISDFTKLSTIKHFEDDKRSHLLTIIGGTCLEKLEILEDIKDYDLNKFINDYSLRLTEFVDENDQLSL